MRFQSHRYARRPALTMLEVIVIVVAVLLLAVVLLPRMRVRGRYSHRAVCSARLRGIGQAMHICANDNGGWFPHHYYEARDDEASTDHGVQWEGSMGSNDFLRISEKTTPDRSPTKSHPSRSLFLLAATGLQSVDLFICPRSSDVADALRNFGPDAAGGASSAAAQPGKNRFDFSGYPHLSYAYQLPYGSRGKPHDTLDLRMAIAADKGPYCVPDESGLPGTRTVRDKRSGVSPPAAWSALSAEAIRSKNRSEWQRYNSRNHEGAGQNVLLVDGHVDFKVSPLAGVDGDNIYTIQSGPDSGDVLIGKVPGVNETLGPLTQTDSYLVP